MCNLHRCSGGTGCAMCVRSALAQWSVQGVCAHKGCALIAASKFQSVICFPTRAQRQKRTPRAGWLHAAALGGQAHRGDEPADGRRCSEPARYPRAGHIDLKVLRVADYRSHGASMSVCSHVCAFSGGPVRAVRVEALPSSLCRVCGRSVRQAAVEMSADDVFAKARRTMLDRKDRHALV